jgi:hypothetical protein
MTDPVHATSISSLHGMSSRRMRHEAVRRPSVRRRPHGPRERRHRMRAQAPCGRGSPHDPPARRHPVKDDRFGSHRRPPEDAADPHAISEAGPRAGRCEGASHVSMPRGGTAAWLVRPHSRGRDAGRERRVRARPAGPAHRTCVGAVRAMRTSASTWNTGQSSAPRRVMGDISPHPAPVSFWR